MTLKLDAELLAKVKKATGIDDTNKVVEEGLRILVSEHAGKAPTAVSLRPATVRKGSRRVQ